MRIRTTRLKVISGTDAETLEEAYETWRSSLREEIMESVNFSTEGSNIYLFIIYTEG